MKTELLRSDWLFQTVRQSQLLVGRMAQEDSACVDPSFDDFPAPTTSVERWILRGLLMELSERCHYGWPDWRDEALITLLHDTTEKNRHHADLARRACQFIHEHYAEPITLRALSRSISSSKSQLTEAFRYCFRTSVHQYLTEIRVRKAIDQLRHSADKVEAVAMMVGYRSKKNLYQAIRRLTRLTPGEIRRQFRRDAVNVVHATSRPMSADGPSTSWVTRRNGDRRRVGQGRLDRVTFSRLDP